MITSSSTDDGIGLCASVVMLQIYEIVGEEGSKHDRLPELFQTESSHGTPMHHHASNEYSTDAELFIFSSRIFAERFVCRAGPSGIFGWFY